MLDIVRHVLVYLLFCWHVGRQGGVVVAEDLAASGGQKEYRKECGRLCMIFRGLARNIKGRKGYW